MIERFRLAQVSLLQTDEDNVKVRQRYNVNCARETDIGDNGPTSTKRFRGSIETERQRHIMKKETQKERKKERKQERKKKENKEREIEKEKER